MRSRLAVGWLAGGGGRTVAITRRRRARSRPAGAAGDHLKSQREGRASLQEAAPAQDKRPVRALITDLAAN
jgi:hypothetical protein